MRALGFEGAQRVFVLELPTLFVSTKQPVGKVIGDGSNTGLGTAIVEALAHQLDARLDIATGKTGTAITVSKATFTSRMPEAA